MAAAGKDLALQRVAVRATWEFPATNTHVNTLTAHLCAASDVTKIQGNKPDSGLSMTRRNMLALFGGLLTLPTTVLRAMSAPARSSRIVIVDGWVLLEDDLRRLATHVA